MALPEVRVTVELLALGLAIDAEPAVTDQLLKRYPSFAEAVIVVAAP